MLTLAPHVENFDVKLIRFLTWKVSSSRESQILVYNTTCFASNPTLSSVRLRFVLREVHLSQRMKREENWELQVISLNNSIEKWKIFIHLVETSMGLTSNVLGVSIFHFFAVRCSGVKLSPFKTHRTYRENVLLKLFSHPPLSLSLLLWCFLLPSALRGYKLKLKWFFDEGMNCFHRKARFRSQMSPIGKIVEVRGEGCRLKAQTCSCSWAFRRKFFFDSSHFIKSIAFSHELSEFFIRKAFFPFKVKSYSRSLASATVFCQGLKLLI